METNFDSLPVDIILHLFNYLNEKDCIMFSLSGVSDRFSFLCGERRNLSIQRCYCVTQSLFNKYLSSWVCPDVVTCLDTSHCYWLPSNFLLDVVTSMSQLSSLCIQDTKLNLSHLWQIFEKCHLIEKISMSLSTNDVDIFEKMQEHEALLKGFLKLTHLKILAFNAVYYLDSWPLILRLLSYCQKCVDLHLEVVYSNEYFKYDPSDGFADEDDPLLERLRDEFFPQLNWMANLKNFVFLKRVWSISYPDECIKALVKWVFSQYDMNYIERVWIMEDVEGIRPIIMASGNKLKSYYCGKLSSFEEIGKDAVQFGQLEHIGGVGLGRARIFPNLRHIHGYHFRAKGVNELCRTHPKLRHLHLGDESDYGTDACLLPFYMKDDWKLNDLQTLVYECWFPIKNILETFLNATPNIEELHIGYSGVVCWYDCCYYGTDFLKMIGLYCDRLTTLSLSGFCLFEGDFFETIFSGCPQLGNLHLYGGGLGEYPKCLNNLCQSLPQAKKLRDFRLQDDFQGRVTPYQAVLNALLEINRLERIVLYERYEEDDPNILLELSQELTNIIFQFVSNMKHLICFCYVTGSKIEPGYLAELKHKFDEFILPIRPAFWYHVDQSPPKSYDPTVPRIHYDQIVFPMNYFVMPPDF